jgi:dihydrolipoamide dehydrogenase
VADTKAAAPSSQPNPDTIYDIAILGGGPAGYTAAIRAGEYGLKVALVEKEPKLGGTCLHWGCIPTKSILHNAELWDEIKHAKEMGIDNLGEPRLNWQMVLQRKNDVITKHVKGLDYLMRKNKITVIAGMGKLAGPAKAGVLALDVTAADGKTSQVKAKNIFLATGSDARMLPGLTPDDRILSNIEMLNIGAVPKSLIVIGSGAVGVEFGSIFKSFGSDVTILEFLPRIVAAEDEEISRELARSFKKRGINIETGAKVEKVERTGSDKTGGVKVTYTSSANKQVTLEAEKCLVAVGRAPRTAGLNLEKTKIVVEKGSIMTDEWMQTAEPGIYAIGDIVAGLPLLAHGGAMCGMVAAAHVAKKYARPVRRDRMPACTYCEPQIGSVGLTEASAKEKGYTVKVGKFPFSANSKASILGQHEGFVKVVSDAKYGEILGVHIIGPQATELISEAVTAITLEATIEEMMFTIHAHPTLAEAMLDGFSMTEGMAINI